jgi:polyhydroxyalkanoate synthesis regulator phasin
MARDDRLKNVQEAGADFLDAARARAEEFLRELTRAGEGTQDKAQEAFQELVASRRKGTETLISSITKEITSQLGALGFATKKDLADLEARLSKKVAPKKAGAAKAPGPSQATAKKGAAKKAPAKKGPAKKAAG